MNEFVVSLVSGLTLGGTLALISLGLVLAFRATHTFNFAHGQLMLLPAFIVGYWQSVGGNTFLIVTVALLISALTGAAFYLLVLRRTAGMPVMMGIIATFGLAFVIDGIMGIVIPSNQYGITLSILPDGTIDVLGAAVSAASLTMAVVTFLIALAVILGLRYTSAGASVRAAGQDVLLASQSGINVRRVHAAAWAIAALLAGVAGISYGSVTVANSSMIHLGLVAIPAIILGGIDSIEGALVGGLAVGLIQSFTQTYLGGEYVDLLTYGVSLLVLLVLPQGFLGTKEIVRA